MIVWLASYPRSGNTLLRTVIHQTLGLKSYPDRSEWPRILRERAGNVQVPGLRQEIAAIVGHRLPDQAWETFYPQALESSELHLVKTHEPPIDGQPAIYVVRDGRKAVCSYFHKLADTPSLQAKSLLQIIAGEDWYGDWTSHFHAWMVNPSGPRLLVHYEELVGATPELVERLAGFLGRDAVSCRPWHNPFAELHARNPTHFRRGAAEWVAPDEWTAEIDRAFFLLHGRLMHELHYATGSADGLSNSMRAALREIIEREPQRPQAVRRPARERERLLAVLSAPNSEPQATSA